MKSLKAAAREAELDYRRHADLAQGQYVSRAQLDRARAARDTAVAARDAARAQLASDLRSLRQALLQRAPLESALANAGRAVVEELKRNALMLAKTAKILKMPVVLRMSVGSKYGAQHSQDWSALVGHMPGLKVYYPAEFYAAAMTVIEKEEQLAGKRQEDGNPGFSDGLKELGDDNLCTYHREG